MLLSEHLLPLPWLVAGFVGYIALLGWAAAGLDRRRLMRETQRQHLLFASCVAVMSMWLLRSAVEPGVGVHVLGMTALTLLVGWRQAMLGSLFPVVGTVAAGAEPWQTAGLAGLVLAALPIGVTHLIWLAAERALPRRVSVYLVVCALCGSAVAVMLARLLVLCLLLATGAYTLNMLGRDYLSLLALALVPEAIVNAVAVAALAAWRPQWLSTLPRQRYLSR